MKIIVSLLDLEFWNSRSIILCPCQCQLMENIQRLEFLYWQVSFADQNRKSLFSTEGNAPMSRFCRYCEGGKVSGLILRSVWSCVDNSRPPILLPVAPYNHTSGAWTLCHCYHIDNLMKRNWQNIVDCKAN